ncbi:MAG: peptide deformylase [Pseudomonadales bacterium]|jgi:peptide deformylase|nr:peptide deformylase [Pseudomonadales bacterium]
MSIRPVIEYPDPRLHQVSEDVTRFDDTLCTLVRDLEDTLKASGGIGLSAPQLGELRRVAVLDLSEDKTAPELYVNPVIVERRLYGFAEESCLSLPGVEGSVLRSVQVRVRAQDAAGAFFERELEYLHACALQHEIDHLDGRLFVDRFSVIGRWRFRRGAGARLRRRAEAEATV